MRTDSWLIDEPISLDDPTDVLTIVREIRHHLAHDPRDEDLGFRSLLEQPEALSRSWRRDRRAA